MKRKFLAKAITLGLLLAMPLSAQATKFVNQATDESKVFPNGLELSIDSTNVSSYNNDHLVFYNVTKTGEEVQGDINFEINGFKNEQKQIVIIQAAVTDATTNINGNINISSKDIKANRLRGVLAGLNTGAVVINGDVNVDVEDSVFSGGGIRAVQAQNNAKKIEVNGNVNVNAANTSGAVYGISMFDTAQANIGGNIDVNISNVKKAGFFRAAALSSTNTVKLGTAAKPADLNMKIIGTSTSDFIAGRIQTVYSSADLTHYGNANLYMENLTALKAGYDNISGYWVQKNKADLFGDVNVTYVATAERADTTMNQNIFGVSVGEGAANAVLNHTGNVNVYLAGKAEKMGLENNTVYGSVEGAHGTYKRTGLRTLYFGTDSMTFDSSEEKPFKGSFTNFDVIKVNKGSTLVLDTNQKTGFTGDQDFLGNHLKPDGKSYFDLAEDSTKVNGITAKGGTLSLSKDNSLIVDQGASAKIAAVSSNEGSLVVQGAENIVIGSLSGDQVTINTDTVKKGLLDIGSNTNKSMKLIGDSKASEQLTGSNATENLQQLADTVNVQEGNKQKQILLEQGAVLGSMQGATDENGKVIAQSVVEEVNPDNEAISNMGSISLMTWRAENNDMNKRLGELRDSKGEHGAWARMARGESKYGAQNVKNQYNYYQVGYDEKLSVDPHWTLGIALTRTEGNSSFSHGSAENKHTGVAVYGSYLKDDGSFIDLIAKYARMKNEFTINGGAGNGDFDTNGYSVSAEYGKRFTKNNGFWIEPQVELTYGYVGAASYLSSNGVQVRQDGMDSLVGRIGFSIGRYLKAGNVYARASYLYDFDGETKVSFNKGASRSFEQDLGGGWWEVGVGTNINLSDATHLYFDVEKTYGGNIATPWQWNAGVRWSF